MTALLCYEATWIEPLKAEFLSTELLETRSIRPFSFSFNTTDYRILHMDQDQGRLYLGSCEYIVSLDMQNINKEPLIVIHFCKSQYFSHWFELNKPC